MAEAERLFQEVGLTEFDPLTPSFTTYINLTNLIAHQMEDIGIKVNITSQDVAAARAKATEGDYEAMVEGISNAVASTLTSIDLAYVPGGGTYYHSAPPPENWLGLLADARVTPPGPERNAVFKEMDTIMREEWIPKIPTIRQNLYTLRWAYVHNYDPIPGAMFTATVFFDVWLDEAAPAI